MEAGTKTKENIDGSMLIGEAVAKYPEIAPVLQAFGLHCIGCHVNPYESIEQGAMGHGMSKEVFNEMLKEANNEIAKFSEGYRRVMPPKSKRVGECDVDCALAGLVGDVVEIAGGIRMLVVDGRRHDVVVDRQDRDHGLHAAGAPEEMTGHGLGG